MGDVWLATELRLGRKVALKLLRAALTQDPARVSRFEQEARAASALNHPNVCTILALGETSGGQHFIAMEYIDGETLRKRLAAGPLSVPEVLDIGIQVASALMAAHASGIVHRDIKPENVMIRPDGFVKVLDFGVAKLVSASDAGGAQSTRTTFKTGAGHVVGTIAYMSPEQARGQQVDARTDIWAHGAMLYEMVTGRAPFTGASDGDVLAAILDREPAPLARFASDAPQELQRIVTKALRKDPRHRYQSISDLLVDVQALREELLGERRTASSRTQPFSPAAKGSDRSGARLSRGGSALRRLAIGVTALLAAMLLAALWWWVRAPASPPGGVASSGTAERTLTRATSGPGLQTDATFSPDGRS